MKEFAQEFMERFPENRPQHRSIGLELEHPVVRSDCFQEFDITRVFDRWENDDDWVILYDDHYTDQRSKAIYKEGRVFTPEYGTGVFEAVLPPRSSLWEIDEKDGPWLKHIRDIFNEYGAQVLGYGIQPLTLECKRTRAQRYDILREKLTSAVDIIGITASSQVSFEVSRDEIIPAVNALNALSGISIALTTNSPVAGGEEAGALALREAVWDTFTPERCGLPPYLFDCVEHYLRVTGNFPVILYKDKNGFSSPQKPIIFNELVKKWGEPFNLFEVYEATVWWNARPRAAYGTIEIRPNCAQPHNQYLAVAAFWLGLVETLSEVEELTTQIPWDIWNLMRVECIKSGLSAKVGKYEAQKIAKEALLLSEKGLKIRGLNEERLLDPLWDRFSENRVPADTALEAYREGGVAKLIDIFS